MSNLQVRIPDELDRLIRIYAIETKQNLSESAAQLLAEGLSATTEKTERKENPEEPETF